jgi:hypothetical protein
MAAPIQIWRTCATGDVIAIILTLWGVVAGAFALMVLTGSKSAIHEILAGMGFLIATVAIGCAAIIHAVKGLDERLGVQRKESAAPVSTPVHEW